MNLHELFDLTSHNGDVYVGQGLEYPWGGLYGGHIVAQALRAAAFTIEDGMLPHSVRAYFIRRGKNTQPVRYEVDRIRDGKSFSTRRVVARQDDGAIPQFITVIVDRGGTCAQMAQEAGIDYEPMLSATDLGYDFGS